MFLTCVLYSPTLCSKLWTRWTWSLPSWSSQSSRKKGQRRVNYVYETWVREENAKLIALTVKRANLGWPDGSPVFAKPHSRKFCEHKPSLENRIWFTQNLVWIFALKERQALGWVKCNNWGWWIGKRWGRNACKSKVEIKDSPLANPVFHLAQQSWNSIWQREWEILFSQNTSFGKYLRILNVTSDLLGFSLRGNRVFLE